MSNATATVTYRKTKAGQWVAFGPASVVRPGYVTVTKKSGESKQELVESVGRTFTVNGRDMVYGYLAAKAATTSAPRHSDTCDECGSGRATRWATDSSGLRGRVCNACYGPSYALSFA
jgi:hypothetical protein